jgi:PAS domain S-box-containing protein
MNLANTTRKQLLTEVEALRDRLTETEETLEAIRNGDVDALVVAGPHGTQLYTLTGAADPYRVLVEEMNQGAATLSAEGVILYCNRHFAKLLQLPQESVIGSELHSFIIPAKRNVLAGLLQSGKSGRAAAEITVQTADAALVPVEVEFNPLPLDSPAKVCLVVTNLTERKKTEEALQERTRHVEEANRLKSQFLTNMSHELRTPLNAVIGFTGTLLMRLPGPLNNDQERQLRIIQSSGKHLLSLLNDILDLAKIESGNLKLRMEPVICQSVIGEIAMSLRPLAERKALTLAVQQPAQDVVTSTDRRALSQILLNLTNNAIKFTEQGSVTLDLRQREDHSQTLIEIAVIDTGVGIRSEDQEKLFQVFMQVDGSTTRPYEGTGLGLHLSQKLASLLDAKIDFQSSFGQGSTFKLVLRAKPPSLANP